MGSTAAAGEPEAAERLPAERLLEAVLLLTAGRLLRRSDMLDAAAKALAQMLSPQFRWVLVKSSALAVAVLAGLGILLHRLLVVLLDRGVAFIDSTAGHGVGSTVHVLGWLLELAAGLGMIASAVLLIPAATAIVASLFCDEIAEAVERAYYPLDPVGTALPIGRASFEAAKAALLTIVIYLCALPLVLVAGTGLLIFFLATAYLQGRIYFELAVMRFMAPAQAMQLRRMHQGTVFLAGLLIAAFLSIPIVSLATPLFAVALMVHVHKRLGRDDELRVVPRF